MCIVALAGLRICCPLFQIDIPFLAPLSEHTFERLLVCFGQHIHYPLKLNTSLRFGMFCKVFAHSFLLMELAQLYLFSGNIFGSPFRPSHTTAGTSYPIPSNSAIPWAYSVLVSFFTKYHRRSLSVSASLNSITPYVLPQ